MLTLTIGLFFLILAVISFLLAAFKVTLKIVELVPLAWAFVFLAVIFGFHLV